MTSISDTAGAADALDSRIHLLLKRSPFTVLGYSAEDQVWCPNCLHYAAGLMPGRPDTNGQPVRTIYLADSTTREERCGHCDTLLINLHPRLQAPTLPLVAEPSTATYKAPATARPPIIRKRSA